jgi:large subunit ribosomal protein L18
VRRSLKNIHVQLVAYEESGDKVLLEETSKSLKKYGWLGHCGNTSSAYLTGLLLGLKARQRGVSEAILDIGMQTSVKGSSLYAAALGARDAGLKIPIGDIAPSQDRISGKHTASYAEKLKKEGNEKYRKQFSAYLKSNLNPEDLPKHFEEIRNKIIAELSMHKKAVTA